MSHLKRCVAVASAFLVTGCSAVNDFSSNAATYNRSTELVQDQGILLNVLRASRRRPLVFGGVQTISGAMSAQGTLGLSLPLAQNGGTTAATMSPTLQMSGGPTVSEGFVDTQEFYQGLLNPLSMKQIDLFVKRGIPPSLLYTLFFSQISVSQEPAKDPVSGIRKPLSQTYHSDVRNIADYNDFETLIDDFLDERLTIVAQDSPKQSGPWLTREDIDRQENFVAKAVAAGLEVKEVGYCDLDDRVKLKQAGSDKKKKGLKGTCDTRKDDVSDGNDAAVEADDAKLPGPLYRLQKPSTDYQFCLPAEGAVVTADSCGDKPPKKAADTGYSVSTKLTALNVETPAPATQTDVNTESKAATTTPKAVVATPVAPESLCAFLTRTVGTGFDCNRKIKLSFMPRSTYGVIYFLGEVVREKLYPDQYIGETSSAHDTKVKVGKGKTPAAIFVLQKGDQDAFLAVDYDKSRYFVSDVASEDKTNEVIDLVAELVALNKSSKDLPASNVITAVGIP